MEAKSKWEIYICPCSPGNFTNQPRLHETIFKTGFRVFHAIRGYFSGLQMFLFDVLLM